MFNLSREGIPNSHSSLNLSLSFSKHTHTSHITDPLHIRINVPNSESCPPLVHTAKPPRRHFVLSCNALPVFFFLHLHLFYLFTAKPLEGTLTYRLNVLRERKEGGGKGGKEGGRGGGREGGRQTGRQREPRRSCPHR